MENKSIEEILSRLWGIQFKESFDAVVGIANGGVVPAALLSERLRLPLEILRINWRGVDNVPCREKPELLRTPDFEIKGKHLLIVDDRVKTGATFSRAKEILKGAALIRSFAVNGPADYFLYDESCFRMPWRRA